MVVNLSFGQTHLSERISYQKLDIDKVIEKNFVVRASNQPTLGIQMNNEFSSMDLLRLVKMGITPNRIFQELDNNKGLDVISGLLSSSSNCDPVTQISTISSSTMTQDSAANYCLRLNYNGYSDWRLPTLDEYLRLRTSISFPDSYFNGFIHTITFDYLNYHTLFQVHDLILKTKRSDYSGTYYPAHCRCVR